MNLPRIIFLEIDLHKMHYIITVRVALCTSGDSPYNNKNTVIPIN